MSALVEGSWDDARAIAQSTFKQLKSESLPVELCVNRTVAVDAKRVRVAEVSTLEIRMQMELASGRALTYTQAQYHNVNGLRLQHYETYWMF